MKNSSHRLLYPVICLLWALSVLRADAYALLGPYEPWMDTTNGFKLPGDIGGPMEIDKGYRWNVPVVTYAYDQSFLAYFGNDGVAAVESAINMLNALPPASQINPADYLSNTTGVNYLAQSEGLADLKSTVLSSLLQQLGLASPVRYAFCLRSFSTADNLYTIVQRNYDPYTNALSASVNGTLYSYHYMNFGSSALIIPSPVDVFADTYTAVADNMANVAGNFYLGLTADDVGGLRQLLNTNVYRFETLLPDVHGAFPNGAQFANLALRAGIDKVTFTRVAVDALTGQLFAPFTNRYTDTYVSNDLVITQQLERVVTTPDIIFSVTDVTGIQSGVQATGTTNWLNNAALNGQPDGAGPGVIRPPVRIALQKGLEARVQSGDSGPDGFAALLQTVWSSFDETTDTPVAYPQASFAGDGQMTVSLTLLDARVHPLPSFLAHTWQLPVPLGGSAVFQTSSNLVDWVSRMVVTNRGLPVEWSHICSHANGYFRVVPH